MTTANFDALLDTISLDPSWRKLAAQTTDKDYRRIVAFDNVTSYSQLLDLHACPRYFQLAKAEAKQPKLEEEGQSNLDFAFGHSVGAGIQTLFATRDLDAGLFAAFISWKADYFADNGKGKSLAHAQLAVEMFHSMDLYGDYELMVLPDGTPGVELAFAIDMQNGHYHYGHIDLVLRNRLTGKIAVTELKTTGFKMVDEAMYANSSQALGYGVVVDAIAPGETEYEVIYHVYSCSEKEWHTLPFGKSLTDKASWLQDILLDHANMATYRKLNFFPKRGENCINKYRRRCKYFGICDLTSHAESYTMLSPGESAENVNFKFTLSELIERQKEKQLGTISDVELTPGELDE